MNDLSSFSTYNVLSYKEWEEGKKSNSSLRKELVIAVCNHAATAIIAVADTLSPPKIFLTVASSKIATKYPQIEAVFFKITIFKSFIMKLY